MSKSISFLGPIITGAILVSGLAISSIASAVPLFATSYDMPNGNSGTFNYWDDLYSGFGNKLVNNAALSGGLGDLTDGYIETQNWNLVEGPLGPNGPYVGWTIDPFITFHFAGNVIINSVTIHVDDSNNFGGVMVPLSVDINGTNFGVIDPGTTVPISVTFNPTTQLGSSLTMQLNRRSSWVFMSEVTFDGQPVIATPEPASIALFGLGLLGLGAARRRQQKAA